MRRIVIVAICGVAALAAGCGSSSSSSNSSSGSGSATSGASGTTNSSPGALSAEAKSTASGDIPDSQVFVTLHGAAFSMQYPEGWVQRGGGSDVTLQDKNNLVRVVVRRGTAPSAAQVSQELQRLKQTTPSLQAGAPSSVTVGKTQAVKVSYTTQSAANPVTGKRVLLLVDRYVLPGAGRYAIVDLGSPKGVDNVDAYKMMIGSFRWR
jgi:uncharacterized protein YceK